MAHSHISNNQIGTPQKVKLENLLQRREEDLPLLEYFLKEGNSDFSFSDESMKKIKQIRINSVIKNLIFLNEFKLIVKAFEKVSIKVILLKGLSMEPLYPNGLRTFSDIDLLVKKRDLHRIGLVMGQLGYVENIEPRQKAINVRKNIGYFKKKGTSLLVECHYLLGPSPYLNRLPTFELFKEARKIKIGDLNTLVLSYEDTLINLALHIFSHIPDPCIISVCDIRQFVLHYEKDINWDILISKVVKYKLAMPMRFAFNRILEVFDIPALFSILGKLKDIRISKRENLILSLMENPNKKAVNLGKLLFGFRTVRKIQLILYMLFPSRKYIQERFKVSNSKIIFLYYFKNIKENVIMAFSWFLSE
jgi:hypothetical protein